MSVRRTVAAVLLVAAAVLLTGCRTDVEVSIAVHSGGSGTVRVTVDLDAEATRELGDPAGLALSDLRSAGWEIAGPIDRHGGIRLTALRAFGSPEQLASVLDEVGGSAGVFRGTSLRIVEGFASTSTRFRTRLHLAGDLSELSDPELTALLGGLPLGRTPAELAASGATSADAGRLTVEISLPGGVDDSNGRIVAGVARWSVPFAGGARTDRAIAASSTTRRVGTLLLLGGGIAAIGVAVLLAATWARRSEDPPVT